MIHCVGLTCRFGASGPAVDGVDLEVGPGEVLGLLGPNGGGKSTLLLMLAGLVRPTSGTVTIGGTPAHALPLAAAGRVGLITAEPGLYAALTVRENLLWFAGLYGMKAADVGPRLAGLAEELDLGGHLDRRAGDLSSGQRQKASLIRALLLAPAVLLFDEPTANLDPLASQVILEQIRTRADQGIAVVLCTHDLDAAARVCDAVVVLDRTIRARQTLSGVRAPLTPSPLLAWYQGVAR